MDVVGRVEGELRPGTSNPARIRASFGGVARNVAENLARLGVKALLGGSLACFMAAAIAGILVPV